MTKIAIKTIQKAIKKVRPLLASSLSFYVLPRKPWYINVKLPLSCTQTVLIKSSIKAPAASSNLSFASKIAKLAAGGNKATDTITPTNDADIPVVIERAAAAPDAKAKTISPIPTLVLVIAVRLGKQRS